MNMPLKNVYSLESLEFLGSVDFIYQNAFYGCRNLKTVTFHNTLEEFQYIIDNLDLPSKVHIRTMRFNKQFISSKKQLLDYFGNTDSGIRNLLEKVDIEFF